MNHETLILSLHYAIILILFVYFNYVTKHNQRFEETIIYPILYFEINIQFKKENRYSVS